MTLYNIAGLKIKLNCGNITLRNAKKYLANSEDDSKPDITITTDLIAVQNKAALLNLSIDSVSYLYDGNEFARQLLNYNGIWIHASAVVVDNKAYLFSAPCGTGKSTHTSKWLELFGDKAYILNDDKPAIRVFDDGIYAYGTPWSGKHDISVNKKVPLKGICFLRRSATNRISTMASKKVVEEMIKTSTFKITEEQLFKKIEILDKIVQKTPIFEMGCTPTIEAAKMAYEVMSKAEVK